MSLWADPLALYQQKETSLLCESMKNIMKKDKDFWPKEAIQAVSLIQAHQKETISNTNFVLKRPS